MIFDLKSGKRRRVVQVVFGFLAFVFFISFVGFGIGSDVSGGIFDAIGLGGNDSSSDSGFEEQIEEAEAKLETDPEDRRALIDLIGYRFRAATGLEDGVVTDQQTGATSISEDARSEFVAALASWERYLATEPRPVSTEAAANVLQISQVVFQAALTDSDPSAALGSAEDAAKAAAVLAEERKTASDYATWARYAYIAGEIEDGDAASDRAVAVSDTSTRDQIEQTMKTYAKQGASLNKQLEKLIKQGDAEGAIDDPFGTLGGGAGAAPPATTP